MITRPTTDVLLRDCCRELTDVILPALQDDTVKLRLIMTVTVLGNAAVRAANEIAWMRQETDDLLDFVNDVAAADADIVDDVDNGIPAALAAVTSAPHESLLLRDVVEVYEKAGRAFDAALRVVQRAEAAEFIDRAAALLRARVEAEKQVMADYAIVGR